MTPLSRDETAALTSAHQRGDRTATTRLLVQFEGLAIARAAHRTRGYRGDADVEDLRQEARLGLLRAFDKFDPRNGASLLTYATWWVDAAVNKAARKQPIVALTSREQKLVASSPRRLAHSLGRDRDAAVERMGSTLSLDLPLGEASSPEAFIDRLVSDAPGPEEQAIAAQHRSDRKALLRRALKCLRPKALAVFTRRFLVDEPETLESIAQGFGLSRERIRQIEKQAFAEVARAMGSAAVHSRPTGVLGKPRRKAVVAALACLFFAAPARADCFTVRDLATAIAVTTPTQPGGLRSIDPGARVCTAETAGHIRDELAELREANRVLAAELFRAFEIALTDRRLKAAELAAKDDRIATLERPVPEPSRWPDRGIWGGGGLLVGLLLGILR